MRFYRFPATLHPKIIPGTELPKLGENFTLDSAKQYFGIFSVFLVPPGDVLFPTVPYKTREKTVFGLCRMVRGSTTSVHFVKGGIISAWKAGVKSVAPIN